MTARMRAYVHNSADVMVDVPAGWALGAGRGLKCPLAQGAEVVPSRPGWKGEGVGA